LFNRIREELGLAYYVGAQSFMAYGAGAFYFYVGTDPKKLDLVEEELRKEIADLAVFCASPRGGYLSGTTIDVDAGAQFRG
jgi:predicted Zn-dependent peptidase